MRALVTGGGGFLGLAIVRRLLKQGTTVCSFSRRRHDELDALDVEQRLGDLADEAAVRAAVAGCDVVFHVAAKAGIWGPYEDYHRTNFIGTKNVIAACREQGVSRLVYTSSPSVVFDGRDMEGVDESAPYPSRFAAHYPKTKAAAEQLVRAANDDRLGTVCLRPHLIWGPGDNHLLPRLIARARAGQLRRMGDPKKLVDTTYIDNAAEAHLLAAEKLKPGAVVAGRVYFISQGEPVNIWEMIDRLLEAAGAPTVQQTIPKEVALALAWGFENVHALLRRSGEPRLTRFVVQELCTSHWFDLSAARRDLGYRPTVSISEGLHRLREHLSHSC
jgi:nucleoside-diphosphate-sugar epimerase